MATQNLVEQVLIFIASEQATNDVIDLNELFRNNLVQALGNNSLGKKIIFGFKSFADFSTTPPTCSPLLELRCYVQPGFVATIQANIPALQADFPQYTIATFGAGTTYGN